MTTDLQLFRQNRCKSIKYITIISSRPGFQPTVKFSNGIPEFLEQLKGLLTPLTVETDAFTHLELKVVSNSSATGTCLLNKTLSHAMDIQQLSNCEISCFRYN